MSQVPISVMTQNLMLNLSLLQLSKTLSRTMYQTTFMSLKSLRPKKLLIKPQMMLQLPKSIPIIRRIELAMTTWEVTIFHLYL